jgi:hypothetical protein
VPGRHARCLGGPRRVAGASPGQEPPGTQDVPELVLDWPPGQSVNRWLIRRRRHDAGARSWRPALAVGGGAAEGRPEQQAGQPHRPGPATPARSRPRRPRPGTHLGPDRRAAGHHRCHRGPPLPEHAMINLTRITGVMPMSGQASPRPAFGHGPLLPLDEPYLNAQPLATSERIRYWSVDAYAMTNVLECARRQARRRAGQTLLAGRLHRYEHSGVII